MDLAKTGKFIAEKRKNKNYTQAKLAEILGVSEKTISKWECGKGFPDTTLILPLCEALDISANELLSAKDLSMQEYKIKAEENLMLLKGQQLETNKHLLALEWVVGYMSILTFLVLIAVAGFVIKDLAWQIVLIVFGFLNFFVGVFIAIRIECKVGFYECEHCHNRYIPSFKAFIFSMHMGRTRYLKCPKCKKYSWNKKRVGE